MLVLLRFLILALWASVGPRWDRAGDAFAIADATARAVLADG